MKQYFDMTTLEELIMFSIDKNGEINKEKLLKDINLNIRLAVDDAIIEAKEEWKAEQQYKVEQFGRMFNDD